MVSFILIGCLQIKTDTILDSINKLFFIMELEGIQGNKGE